LIAVGSTVDKTSQNQATAGILTIWVCLKHGHRWVSHNVFFSSWITFFFCNQKYGIWGSPAEKNHRQTDAANFPDALRVAPVCSSNACTSHQIQQRLDLTGL
jgi:hypothetical protein